MARPACSTARSAGASSSTTAGRFPLLRLGRHSRRSHGLHPLRAAAAARGLLADRPAPDRGRSLLGARPGRIVRQSSCRPRFRRARGRQPLPPAHGQRVRHRAVHRRQGRHHAAAAGLRQGDPGVRLPAACVIATVNVALSLGLYGLYRVALGGWGARCWSGRSGRWLVWILSRR